MRHEDRDKPAVGADTLQPFGGGARDLDKALAARRCGQDVARLYQTGHTVIPSNDPV